MKNFVSLSHLRVLLLALVPGLGGCAYLQDRGMDFTDMIAIGASTGGGIQLRGRATRALTVEIGAQKDEHFYGWRRRNSQWEESSYGLGLACIWSPRLGNEAFAEWSWSDIFKTSHTKTHFLSIDAQESWRYHVFVLTQVENGRWVDALDVEIAAGALFVGLQLAVRPGELLDLLAGFFGADLAGDDQAGALPAVETDVGAAARPSQ